MPLEFPISVKGEDLTAYLSLPVDKEDSIVIPGYDLEEGLVLEALGLDPDDAITLWSEWRQGLSRFLLSEDNLRTFLEQLKKQGLDSLPITREELGKTLSETVNSLQEVWTDTEVRDVVNWQDFFEIVKEEYPGCAKLKWNEGVLEYYADLAFQDGLYDIFDIIDRMSMNTLYSLEAERCECSRTSLVSKHCEVSVRFIVLDSVEDQFVIEGTYSYTDAELENPEWIIDDNMYDGPKTETEDFLDTVGEETDWEIFIEERCRLYDFELDPPPSPAPDGDAAIFINEEFYDRFNSYDAERFEEMSQEAIELHGLGESVVALTLRDDVDPDDPDFDEMDMDNYE